MQILSINNINHKTCNTNFKSLKPQMQKVGILESKTSYMIQDFLHGFEDIKNLLSRKTDLGLAKIAENYPEITLGENLVFHNCGEDKSSISIRVADSEQNRGLTYIARRQGNTESTKKIILNSFMLEGHDKLVKNFKPNYSKYFPKQKEYFSKEAIIDLHLEEDLQKVLADLEPMFLKFRKYLVKNSNTYLKLPDGKINHEDISKIKEAFRICNNIEELVQNISHKRYLEMNNNFKDYGNISGLKSYIFKNLGEDEVSINFSEFQEKRGYDLKRLYVYDKEGSIIKLFTIIDNEKFATNINPNTPSVLPEKYTYANTKELEKKYLPEFQKYFELYLDKLKEYQMYVNKTVDEILKQDISGEFDLNASSLLSEALDWYKIAKIKLRKLPQPVDLFIRTKVQKIEPAIGKTGFWLKDDDRKKIIQFLPLNNQEHKNLIRISITDMNTSQKKDFLIHDFKHIVKNYNPQYPTVIPKFLKFASEKEIEESELEFEFRHIRKKCEELAIKADEAFEKREGITKQLKEQKKLEKAEEKAKKKVEADKCKEFKMNCKKMFNDALNNIDSNFENFNQVILEIQNNVAEFYNSQKNNS